MMTDIEKYERIEQYLKGKLQGEELTAIEEQIQADPVFAQEVAKNRLIHQIVFERSLMDMKSQISGIHDRHSSGSSGSVSWKTIIIISLILIVSAILLIFLLTKPHNVNTVTPLQQPEQYTEQINMDENPGDQEIKSTQSSSFNSKHYVRNTLVVSTQKTDSGQILVNRGGEIEVTDLNSMPPVMRSDSKEETANKLLMHELSSSVLLPVSNPCEGITITGMLESESSCNNSATGKISVNRQSVTGGAPPYQLSVDGGKNFYAGFTINNLMPSTYRVVIKDINDCTGSLGDIVIGIVNCSFESVFSPEKGEVWEIPEIESSGDIKIFNRQGILVFSANYDLPGEYEWDGSSNTGQPLPMGAYMFILTKSGNEVIRGTVTIVR